MDTNPLAVTSTSVDSSVEPFQVADITIYPAGDTLVLVHSKNTQETRLLSKDIADILTHCREFKTLDAHLQAYARDKPINPAVLRSLRRTLPQLLQQGFLLSRKDVYTKLQSSYKDATASASGSITTIGFPTCDRLESLQHSLASAIAYCQHNGRDNDFVVVDDSASSTTRDAYRHMLHTLKCAYSVDIAYAGLEEKTSFARKLAEGGNIPYEIVAFACLGTTNINTSVTTIGANRNALLLHTVGDCIFSSDDDVSYRVSASPDKSEGLALGADGSPIGVWFFPDRERMLQSIPSLDADVLRQHEQCLGNSPGACCVPYLEYEGLQFDSATPTFLRHMMNEQGKILLTINGSLGDCSWDNPHYFLFQRGETFQRLVHSEQLYATAHQSREMAQVVNQLTITASANPLVAMCIGLDNRELLPPFTPLGRGEEIAFATMLSLCFPAAYTAHLPWMLLHTPPEKRAFTPQQLFEVSFSGWVPACMSGFNPGVPAPPARQLEKLGQYLQDVGRLSKAAFEDLVRYYVWQSMRTLIANLEAQVQAVADPPIFWLQDVRAFIAQARQHALLPVEQLYAMPGGHTTMQSLLTQFGRVIEWWPTMVETARRLRTEGHRLAAPIR